MFKKLYWASVQQFYIVKKYKIHRVTFELKYLHFSSKNWCKNVNHRTPVPTEQALLALSPKYAFTQRSKFESCKFCWQRPGSISANLLFWFNSSSWKCNNYIQFHFCKCNVLVNCIQFRIYVLSSHVNAAILSGNNQLWPLKILPIPP